MESCQRIRLGTSNATQDRVADWWQEASVNIDVDVDVN